MLSCVYEQSVRVQVIRVQAIQTRPDLDPDGLRVRGAQLLLGGQQRRYEKGAAVPRQRHLELVQQVDDVAARVHGAEVGRAEHVLQVVETHHACGEATNVIERTSDGDVSICDIEYLINILLAVILKLSVRRRK